MMFLSKSTFRTGQFGAQLLQRQAIPYFSKAAHVGGKAISKEAQEFVVDLLKHRESASGSSSSNIFSKVSEMSKRVIGAAEKVAQMTKKPSVLTQVEWACPNLDEVMKTLEDGGAFAVAYHGTSLSDVEDMINQHAINAGLLEKRVCDNGSGDAALYIMHCVDSVHHYTGSEYMIKVASKTLPQLDGDRGTMYFPNGSDIHLLQVLRVQNSKDIKSFVRPSIASRVAVIINELQAK